MGLVLAVCTGRERGPRTLPSPAREERAEPVGKTGEYRFWPRSAPVEPGAAYEFDTGHCGLNFLTDFDGAFWRPIDPDGGEPPLFFYNQDKGTMTLIRREVAVYESSTGERVRLRRINGPVTTFPCI
jgi:hypothetical protein